MITRLIHSRSSLENLTRLGKIYTSFQTKTEQNHTLRDGTYQYGLYKGVPLWVLNEAKYAKNYADRGECRRLRWIIASEIGIILHSIRKLNSINVLLLIQNIFIPNKHTSWTFFKTLSYFLARLRLKQIFFFLEDTPYSKKYITHVLLILAFLPFSFSQKFGSFIFGHPRTMIINNNNDNNNNDLLTVFLHGSFTSVIILTEN